MENGQTQTKKMTFAFIFFVFLLFFPQIAEASVLDNLAPQCKECGNCTMDDFLIAGNNVFNIFVTYIGSLAFLTFALGGVVLLVSHGNQEISSTGRRMIGGGLTGLAVGLFSWFVINFIITTFVQGQTIFGQKWFTYKKTTPTACYPPPTERGPQPTSPPSGPVDSSGWTLVGISQAQKEDASAELAALINCMYKKVPNLQITSISDDDIRTGGCDLNKCNRQAANSGLCPANNACKNDSKCVHSCGSCHYNQGTAPGTHFSQAADFNVNVAPAVIIDAARACGGKINDEGDHIHVSTTACPVL